MNKPTSLKCLIIVHSYHHCNTLKIANCFEKRLNATILIPSEINHNTLDNYNLIGFGSGIDSGKHYKPLLDVVENLPHVTDKKSFIFSTSALQGKKKVYKDHAILRKILVSKGYVVVDEFSCKGFNTNSFIKYIGGMNKNRPNHEDLSNAKKFALSLKQKMDMGG